MAKFTINGQQVTAREQVELVIEEVLPGAELIGAGDEWELALPGLAADTLDRQGWIELEKGPFRITVGDPD